MQKPEIAYLLNAIASLMTLKGESAYRIRAYERAARLVERSNFNLESLAAKKQLTRIPGVGKAIAAQIYQIITTGRSQVFDNLAQAVPLGLLQVLKIPGIGPKTAKTLYETLGVIDLNTLKNAVQAKHLRTISGIGAKKEARIARGIEEISQYLGRTPLGVSLPTVKHYLNQFKKASIYGTVVGEVRQALETTGSMDILLKAENSSWLVKEMSKQKIGYFSSKDLLSEIWNEKQQAFIYMSNIGIPLKIHLAPDDEFGWKQIMLTGPISFTKWIENLARSIGYDIPISGSTEKQIFDMLGISFIPPELRYNKHYWQKSLANQHIEPVNLSDIKGDLHIHTIWSDGHGTIEQMVKRSIELGYSFIAITDHATEIKIIKGITPRKIEAQIKEIADISKKYPQIRILSGVEVDILSDGSLTLPDNILAKLDIVVASIHQGLSGTARSITDRLIKAASNPTVDIIGHPTGRLIGRRAGNSEYFDELFQTASINNTALEINASPHRLDLSSELALRANSFGVRFAISSDAHSINGMDDMQFGIAACARRAGLSPDRIINAQRFETWFPIKPN